MLAFIEDRVETVPRRFGCESRGIEGRNPVTFEGVVEIRRYGNTNIRTS
jgi:hypothetical protein